MTKDYETFLENKRVIPQAAGFDIPESAINPMLFDWQRQIVRWAVKQGRAALFEECGLGKTFQQVEWARIVAEHTGARVLILAPLAVAHQTVSEAARLGVAVRYARSQDQVNGMPERVIITNYDMLSAFDAEEWGGVVLDESSILKAYNGTTRKQITDAFANTPYRLACTATPAPNDHMELGNHAEFLGLIGRNEMLATWFKHDGGETSTWRLKRHGESDFWRWVTSWAVCVSKPSDIGFADDGFDLPPLVLHEHVVATDHSRAQEQGMLFVDGTISATAMYAERRHSLNARCDTAVSLVNATPDDPWIVWCDTNDEADYLRKALPSAVEVRGSDTFAAKEKRLSAFSDREVNQIITKPEIAGFGLNWQHCANMAFVGVTYSFEKTYQALRRSWRFGQTRPVNAHMIYAESEGNIRKALQDKQIAHVEMQTKMNHAMREHGLVQNARAKSVYQPKVGMALPLFL